jgi:hypothetical protein
MSSANVKIDNQWNENGVIENNIIIINNINEIMKISMKAIEISSANGMSANVKMKWRK